MKLKKIISGIITAGILAGYVFSPQALPVLTNAAPAAAANTEGLVSGDFSYDIRNGKAVIVGYTGSGRSVEIPEKLGKREVVSIGSQAFMNSRVKRVAIPITVSTIEEMAFGYCYDLEEITLPDGIDRVAPKAFCGCSSLKKLNISAGVGGIADGAFYLCQNIEKITVSSGSCNYKLENGMLFTYDGKALLLGQRSKSLKTLRVPDGVRKICASAFYAQSSITSVKLPDTLREIGISAFLQCTKLKEVSVPDGAVTIAANAFSYCISLKKVTVPDSVVNFGADVFSGCKKLTIRGTDGSAAYRYARKNNIPFSKVSGAAFRPAQIGGVSAQVKSDGSAQVNWMPDSTADGYEIYMSDKKNGKYQLVTVSQERYTYGALLTGLTPSDQYWFKVRGYKKNGDTLIYGSFSEAVEAEQDAKTIVEKNAPLYTGFINQLYSGPLYISLRSTDSESNKTIVYTLAIDGDKMFAYSDMGDGLPRGAIVNGKDVYALDYKTKTATHMNRDSVSINDRESIVNSMLNSVMSSFNGLSGALSKVKFSSGKMVYNGKSYISEVMKGEYGEKVTVLADKNNNVKYIIEESPSGKAVLEITAFSHSPEQSCFVLPRGFEIIDEVRFWHTIS